MRVVDDYVKAVSGLTKFIFRADVLVFLIPALAISLFFSVLFLLLNLAGSIFSIVTFIPFIGEILNEAFTWIVTISGNIVYYFYAFVILTLLSPVNNLLSAKCDSLLTGSNYKLSLFEFLSDLWRALKINVALLFFYGLTSIFISLFLSVTKLDFLDNSLYFLASSFYFGFSFFDYNFERFRMKISETFGRGIRNWQYVLLGGIIFNGLYLIPYLGLIISSFITTILTTQVFLLRNKFQ
ncbi:MAG: hypothetical protein J0G96_09030 [Flavobacteriia bacterium]|nr:hypothetical protein [Flavobacteriia bacterium]OJX36842.1 MAG: hypothetical protein BGO87_13740 [Flavobacteriia bacterium 40-80]